MRAPWLVRTSSLYFHKVRAFRHTSALLRYNARSLHHRYERAQFTIHFIKEIKNLFLERCLRLVLLRTSLVFLKIPACLYNPTTHLARFLFFNNHMIYFVQFEINCSTSTSFKDYKLQSTCIICFSLRKYYSCWFIQNCTQNHVITYTNSCQRTVLKML